MQKDELEYQTKLTELNAVRAEMLNKLAKEHNWTEQQKHWKAQRIYWWILAILGFVAVIVNGFKSLWS